MNSGDQRSYAGQTPEEVEMYGRVRLWQLSRPVAGAVVTHGLPGAMVIASLGFLASPAGTSTGATWSLVLGWLAGSLLVGVVRRDRPWPLPADLPERAQLQALQAVHDDPVVEDVDVARGVVGYLQRRRRTSRPGPGWLWVIIWLASSWVIVLLVDRLMEGASLTRVLTVQVIALGSVTAGVTGEWRLRTRARAAEAAALQLLAAEGERGGDAA